MSIELQVPEVGESVSEVQIGKWLKSEGTPIKRDEAAVTIESDKATVEINAPDTGVLSKILKKEGETAHVGDVIAVLETNGGAPKTQPASPVKEEPAAAPPPKVPASIMPSVQRAL